VPPVFDFPPLAARTRMLVPAYELMFGKLARRSLFDDYFHSGGVDAHIVLKQLGDSHADLNATVSIKQIYAIAAFCCIWLCPVHDHLVVFQ
uniref:Uncharacterized protein n=1 Tax=Aegilops tauschii subsp. strangulata TaxID=200361 RepID=A0A453DUK4_AEGTS